MIRQETMQLLKTMNALYLAGWSISIVQHTVGKTPEWFRKHFNEDENLLYDQMREHYRKQRKITPLNYKMIDFFDLEMNSELH